MNNVISLVRKAQFIILTSFSFLYEYWYEMHVSCVKLIQYLPTSEIAKQYWLNLDEFLSFAIMQVKRTSFNYTIQIRKEKYVVTQSSFFFVCPRNYWRKIINYRGEISSL